jgi:hypothetical protein
MWRVFYCRDCGGEYGVKYAKPALSFEQQADQLLNRGFQADRTRLIETLSRVSYYRLTLIRGLRGPHSNVETCFSRIRTSELRPGFRDCVLAKKAMNCEILESKNLNLIGGSINGGASDLWHLLARPVFGLNSTGRRRAWNVRILCR